MELRERIALIIEENAFKQIELAELLGVSGSYISTLLSGRNKNISAALASLIEEKLGYGAQWVLSGGGSKRVTSQRSSGLSDNQKMAIFKMERMSEEKVEAILAFMDSLDKVGVALGVAPVREEKPELFAAFADSSGISDDEISRLKQRLARNKGKSHGN